jgi:xylulokinase
VAWVAESEPETWARTRSILLPHDWLTRELTGAAVTDRSDASGTGYFDSTTSTYLRNLIDLAAAGRRPGGDDLELPAVLGPSQAAGELTHAAAAALGLSAGILVGPGAGDQHASALGLGVGPGDLVYSLGTSGVVFTTSLEPVYDTSGRVDGVADATGHWLPLVSTLNAAKVSDVVSTWIGDDHTELGRLAEAAPAGADRPIMAPFLDGERTPDLPHATGLLAGLTGATGRPGLALAALEGLVLGLVSGRRALQPAFGSMAGCLPSAAPRGWRPSPRCSPTLPERSCMAPTSRRRLLAGPRFRPCRC